jgi:hypothetical protein
VALPRDTGEELPGATYQPVAVPGPFAQIQTFAVWPACRSVGASTIKKLLELEVVPALSVKVVVAVIGVEEAVKPQDAVTV